MTVRIVVAPEESLEQALRRFRRAVHREYNRPWAKARRGYYEKPSVLKRKRRKVARLNAKTLRIEGHTAIQGGAFRFLLDWRRALDRSGRSNAVGR